MLVDYRGEEFDPANIDTICFDMDGVLANLFSVDGWEEKLHNQNYEPYAEAEPLVDMEALNDLIADLYDYYGVEPYVLSWGSGVTDLIYDLRVEKVKVAWINKYLPAIPDDHIFVMQYGTPKWEVLPNNEFFGYRPKGTTVLFDDSERNFETWEGIPIHINSETSEDQIFEVLESVLEEKQKLRGPVNLMG